MIQFALGAVMFVSFTIGSVLAIVKGTVALANYQALRSLNDK